MGIQHWGLIELYYLTRLCSLCSKEWVQETEKPNQKQTWCTFQKNSCSQSPSCRGPSPLQGSDSLPASGRKPTWVGDSWPLHKLLFQYPALNINSLLWWRIEDYLKTKLAFFFCFTELWYPLFKACPHVLRSKTDSFPPSYREHTINRTPKWLFLKSWGTSGSICFCFSFKTLRMRIMRMRKKSYNLKYNYFRMVSLAILWSTALAFTHSFTHSFSKYVYSNKLLIVCRYSDKQSRHGLCLREQVTKRNIENCLPR